MTGSLVIVESPAKAKTIQKILNDAAKDNTAIKAHGPYKVLACFGHVRDLPRKEIGVDTSSWTPKYENLDGKGALLSKIRKSVSEASHVFLASDEDTEGEAIAFHLKEVLRLKMGEYSRITFNEITKPALVHAITHPRAIDMSRVEAQESRRILDRIAGYELSPLLWRRFATGGLSAGRVQSAALKMLVDRAKEAKSHESTLYWTLKGEFVCDPCGTTLEAKMMDEEWTDENLVLRALAAIASPKSGRWLATFSQKKAHRGPSAPFTTSTFQQEVYNRFKIPAKRAMQLAQELYEAGHITYMRTDSTQIAQEAKRAIIKYVTSEHGAVNAKERDFKSRAANAQEAHEAIRPTDPECLKPDGISDQAAKVYDLIWRRAIASQMSDAVYADVSYQIRSSKKAYNDYVFTGKHSFLVTEGYMKVYNPNQKTEQDALDKWACLLANTSGVEVAPKSFEATGDVTRCSPLYNEPMLIGTLEKEGIGRPSTYASIIDKLYQKGYVAKGTNPQNTIHVKSYKVEVGSNGMPEALERVILLGGKEADRMVPTSLGERVAEYLENVTPFLLNAEFTASMESELDRIAEAKTSKVAVLNSFYSTFHPAVVKAAAESSRIAKEKGSDGSEGSEGAEGSEDRPLTPKRIIREFKTSKANVVDTRYGPAIFDTQSNKFISLMPFLQWKEKTVEDLTTKDIKFLKSLPMKVDGARGEIMIGRYGLYIKDGSKNLPLKKELWDHVYDGSITKSELTASYSEPRYRPQSRGAASAPRK